MIREKLTGLGLSQYAVTGVREKFFLFGKILYSVKGLIYFVLNLMKPFLTGQNNIINI